jgi:hypothetical protein
MEVIDGGWWLTNRPSSGKGHARHPRGECRKGCLIAPPDQKTSAPQPIGVERDVVQFCMPHFCPVPSAVHCWHIPAKACAAPPHQLSRPTGSRAFRRPRYVLLQLHLHISYLAQLAPALFDVHVMYCSCLHTFTVFRLTWFSSSSFPISSFKAYLRACISCLHNGRRKMDRHRHRPPRDADAQSAAGSQGECLRFSTRWPC